MQPRPREDIHCSRPYVSVSVLSLCGLPRGLQTVCVRVRVDHSVWHTMHRVIKADPSSIAMYLPSSWGAQPAVLCLSHRDLETHWSVHMYAPPLDPHNSVRYPCPPLQLGGMTEQSSTTNSTVKRGWPSINREVDKTMSGTTSLSKNHTGFGQSGTFSYLPIPSPKRARTRNAI